MFTPVRVGGKANSANLNEYIIDSVADVANLPVNIAPGSTAYTADLSLIYIMDNHGVWTKVGGE